MPPPVALLAVLLALVPALAGAAQDPSALSDLHRLLTLQDYNTRVVLGGATVLGVACGLVGTFLLLRKRALLSDAIAHATLPGVALAFLVLATTGGNARSLPALLLGAAVSGTLGMLLTVAITRWSRVKEDAALGIVLSVFFGLGISLVRMASEVEGANSAGLMQFIFGKTASMLASDAALMTVVAAVVAVLCAAFFKEFRLLCFDAEFGAAQGWPTLALDVLLMGLVVAVTVVGLQAVGLILVVAFLVIPPAAARFWTDRLVWMLVASGVLGGMSGLLGAAASAVAPELPSGAVIVLVAAGFFFLSLIFGPARGILWQWLQHRRLAASTAQQHALRALYELAEVRDAEPGTSFARLLVERTWTPSELTRTLRRLVHEGLATEGPEDVWTLTDKGRAEAARHVRNHRLWELYLLEHADVAPALVDRDADRIEHVLDADLVRRLEALLPVDDRMPPSPHRPQGATP